jgi:NADP-dependent 3-hydroxy acid dehydrogenase YdfG
LEEVFKVTATQSIAQPISGRLNGKVALVTGASSGIGSATAKELATEGAKLVLAARREDRLKAIADDIDRTGGEVLVLPVDLSDERATLELIDRAYTHWGRLDILINSAGIADAGSVETADVSSWRRMFEVNALGLMIACKAAIPLMKAQGGGHIVNISSTAGLFVGAGTSGYCASKFAVEAFSNALRLEVSKADRIRITVVEPGLVETELATHISDPNLRQGFLDSVASIEQLQPEDIAAAVVYAVTQPPRVSVNQLLIRPTDSDTQL